MSKHTPAPWEKARSKFPTDGEYDFAISAKGVPVLAEVFGRSSDGGHPPAEANADYIVTAVNSHAPLTECVKVLREALEFYAEESRYQGSNQRRPKDDKYTPLDEPFMTDTGRDYGAIAKSALSRAKELVP